MVVRKPKRLKEAYKSKPFYVKDGKHKGFNRVEGWFSLSGKQVKISVIEGNQYSAKEVKGSSNPVLGFFKVLSWVAFFFVSIPTYLVHQITKDRLFHEIDESMAKQVESVRRVSEERFLAEIATDAGVEAAEDDYVIVPDQRRIKLLAKRDKQRAQRQSQRTQQSLETIQEETLEDLAKETTPRTVRRKASDETNPDPVSGRRMSKLGSIKEETPLGLTRETELDVFTETVDKTFEDLKDCSLAVARGESSLESEIQDFVGTESFGIMSTVAEYAKLSKKLEEPDLPLHTINRLESELQDLEVKITALTSKYEIQKGKYANALSRLNALLSLYMQYVSGKKAHFMDRKGLVKYVPTFLSKMKAAILESAGSGKKGVLDYRKTIERLQGDLRSTYGMIEEFERMKDEAEKKITAHKKLCYGKVAKVRLEGKKHEVERLEKRQLLQSKLETLESDRLKVGKRKKKLESKHRALKSKQLALLDLLKKLQSHRADRHRKKISELYKLLKSYSRHLTLLQREIDWANGDFSKIDALEAEIKKRFPRGSNLYSTEDVEAYLQKITSILGYFEDYFTAVKSALRSAEKDLSSADDKYNHILDIPDVITYVYIEDPNEYSEVTGRKIERPLPKEFNPRTQRRTEKVKSSVSRRHKRKEAVGEGEEAARAKKTEGERKRRKGSSSAPIVRDEH